MYLLGVSAFFHDSAAALVRDGEVVAAAEEERYTRVKHESDFPENAATFCLRQEGISVRDIDKVVFYEKPVSRYGRILSALLSASGVGRREYASMVLFGSWFLMRVRRTVRKRLGFTGEVLFVPHHLSHAASAFYCSPFDSAAVLTIDGVGEWATAAMGEADAKGVHLYQEMQYPQSIGLLYSIFTEYLGFRPNSAEYKVMGLAPYGKPAYLDKLLEIAPVAADGSIRLDMRFFMLRYGLLAAGPRFAEHFGGPPRPMNSTTLTTRDHDLAATIQAWTELAVVRMCRHLARETGHRRLVMAGGVALNCTANSKILRETPFREVFVQPGASDAGCSIGCALAAHHALTKQPNRRRPFNVYLGDRFSPEEVEAVLKKYEATYQRLAEAELCRETARRIARGRVIGWFQGAMEFGPRALGGRSILADPRDPKMKDHLNEAIKLREGFRPFAPSVLKEHAAEVFDLPQADCDYMLFVAPVRPGAMAVPAVTHVDGTARLQTVDRQANPLYHRLIGEFHQLTGCPMVVNTSFNVRGEPIVRTPFDAYRCFMSTGIDDLAVGPFLLAKEEQRPDPSIHYLDQLEPD
jgi:carbamoyltransferase